MEAKSSESLRFKWVTCIEAGRLKGNLPAHLFYRTGDFPQEMSITKILWMIVTFTNAIEFVSSKDHDTASDGHFKKSKVFQPLKKLIKIHIYLKGLFKNI